MANPIDPKTLGAQLGELHTRSVHESGDWRPAEHERFVAERGAVEVAMQSVPASQREDFLQGYREKLAGIDRFPELFARSRAAPRTAPVALPRYAVGNDAPIVLPVTDMDGTLLGTTKSEYDYGPAEPALSTLEREGVPVVLNSSKTFAEMFDYRERMGNTHPFIVENGAKVFIPKGYFSTQPEGTHEESGFWVLNLGQKTRDELLVGLASARLHGLGEFTHFAAAAATGISVLTNGLSLAESARANMRMGTESSLWTGAPERKAAFVEHLNRRGIDVVEGGKFTTLTGNGTKGKALAWLSELYAAEFGRRIAPVALGDGGNDLSALDAAQTLGGYAVVIAPIDPRKAPLHETDAGAHLPTTGKFMTFSDRPAEAWTKAMRQIMRTVGVEL